MANLPKWVIDEIGEPPQRPDQAMLARARGGSESEADRAIIRAWRTWWGQWNDIKTRAASEGRWGQLGLRDVKEEGQGSFAGARQEWQLLLKQDPKARQFASSASGKAYAAHFGGGDLGNYLGFMRYQQMQQDLKKSGIGFDNKSGFFFNKGGAKSDDPKTWSWFDAFGEKVTAPQNAFGGQGWSAPKTKNLDSAFSQAVSLGWNPSGSRAVGGDYGERQTPTLTGYQGIGSGNNNLLSSLSTLLSGYRGRGQGVGSGTQIDWNTVVDPGDNSKVDPENPGGTTGAGGTSGVGGPKQKQSSPLDDALTALILRLIEPMYAGALVGNEQQIADLLTQMIGLAEHEEGQAFANPITEYLKDYSEDILGIELRPPNYNSDDIFAGLSALTGASGADSLSKTGEVTTSDGRTLSLSDYKNLGGREFRQPGEFPDINLPGKGGYRLTRTSANPNDSKTFGALAPQAADAGQRTNLLIQSIKQTMQPGGARDAAITAALLEGHNKVAGLKGLQVDKAQRSLESLANFKLGVPLPGMSGSGGILGTGTQFGSQLQQNQNQYSTFMAKMMADKNKDEGSWWDTAWPYIMQMISSSGSAMAGASDKRVKRDITTHRPGLKELRKVAPKAYYYNGKGGTVDGEPGVSVIAQELEKVLPGSVTMMKTSDPKNPEIKGIFPMSLLMTTINAVKELDDKVEHKLSSYRGKK